jgi:serine/threonine protein kinase
MTCEIRWGRDQPAAAFFSSLLGPGAKVGNFEIIAFSGCGGMGEVYRAHDLRLKSDVSIKVVRFWI